MKGTGRLSAGRAVKKLRRLSDGGSVALVGVFRGSTSAVTVLEPGEAAGWLNGLQGEVAYIHDDAVIDPSHVERLRRSHARSKSLMAPPRGPDETSIADTPILLGTGTQVARYLDGIESSSPATLPKIERVPGLDVDHALSCRGPRERPLLVASMIVRDEADQIGACLESLMGFVDRVEIVDTGSIDDTVAIATAYGASVTTAKWTDDFAAARNVALDRSRDARFVLHIDADERFSAGDGAAVRATLESTTERALRVSMRNVVQERVTSEFEAVRVFSTDGTMWIGKVHEFPAADDGTPLNGKRLDGMRIDHLGYDPRIVAAKGKLNRNVALAEAAYSESPCFKTRLDLARSLAWRSDDERAYALFREAADDLTGANEEAAAFVLAHVALWHHLNGDFDRTHELAIQALEHCSGEYAAHLARARAWREQGDDDAIADAHHRRLATELQPPMYDSVAARATTDSLTVGALARLGEHVEAFELAVSVLSTDPSRFDEWKSLAKAPPTLRQTGLSMLASMDPTGAFVDALVGEIPMGELAKLVLAHSHACVPVAHTVVTGVMAAVLAGDESTAAAIAEAAGTALDPEQRAATAERCRLRGATSVAAVLQPATV